MLNTLIRDASYFCTSVFCKNWNSWNFTVYSITSEFVNTLKHFIKHTYDSWVKMHYSLYFFKKNWFSTTIRRSWSNITEITNDQNDWLHNVADGSIQAFFLRRPRRRRKSPTYSRQEKLRFLLLLWELLLIGKICTLPSDWHSPRANRWPLLPFKKETTSID